MGLYGYKDKPVLNISFGEMERTTISSIMAMNPDLVIFDEPTLGQDERYLIKLMRYIEKEKKTGKSFIIISHNFNFLKCICNRVLSLQNGSLKIVDGKK